MLRQAGGLRNPQRGSASTQARVPQPLDCLKRPACPHLPYSTLCPKNHTQEMGFAIQTGTKHSHGDISCSEQ